MKTTGITFSDNTSGRWLVGPVIIGVLLVCAAPRLMAGDERFTFLIKGNLTTSSQIFLNPEATDIVSQGESLILSDFFGVGAEFTYRIPETNIALGVSADYIRVHSASSIIAFPNRLIPVEDGYTVVPVEVTGYFIIPFSGETFGVFMGGGGGLYFGKRSYRIGTTEATASSSTPGFGIHVLGGISYRIIGPLKGIFEMKFRDLQFEAENTFPTSSVRYNDTSVKVSTKPFKSRTQTDGVVFQLGLALSF